VWLEQDGDETKYPQTMDMALSDEMRSIMLRLLEHYAHVASIGRVAGNPELVHATVTWGKDI